MTTQSCPNSLLFELHDSFPAIDPKRDEADENCGGEICSICANKTGLHSLSKAVSSCAIAGEEGESVIGAVLCTTAISGIKYTCE